MSIYNNDKKDYEELVKESIKKAQTLSQVTPEYYDTISNLLKEKEDIIAKNSIFANYKLKRIDKKINDIIIKCNNKKLTK